MMKIQLKSRNFEKLQRFSAFSRKSVSKSEQIFIFGVVLARSFFPQFSIMDSKSCAKECIV